MYLTTVFTADFMLVKFSIFAIRGYMCLNFLSTFIMNCRLKKRKLPKFLKISLHPLKEVTKVEKHLLGDQLSLLDLLVKYSVLYMF